MSKRAGQFERRKNDAYDTPLAAVKPLLSFLSDRVRFIEPCAGDGALVRDLTSHGHSCIDAFDIEPREDDIDQGDALTCVADANADMFITNPPWTREILHPLIINLSRQLPTWLLFDADWAHTRQAKPYLSFCDMIVTVGRVKWISDSPFTGKDNCAWYRFVADPCEASAFYGRLAA